MTQLFANNAASELAGAVTLGDVSLTLKAGDGAKFPTPSGGDFFLVTLYQKVGQDEINHEIVKCTARAGDVLTVVRAQEGTTARAFNPDDPVELRLTAGSVATKDDLTTKQPLDADLTAIAALAGTSGLLKKTAENTWGLDTTSYSTLALGTSAGAALAESGAAGSATTAAKSDHVHPLPTAASVGAEPAITKSTGFATWNGSAWSFDNSTYLTSSAIGSTVQAYAANLTSWAAIAPSAKQDTLVSGTNIKTINGTSVLGSGGITTGDVTVTGTQTLTNKTLTSPISTGAIYNNGSVRGNITAVAALDINCSIGNYFTKTINGASTFTFSNAPATRAYAFTLELTHTSGAVTWPASVQWPGGSAPSLTAGKTHIFVFVTDDGGTRWRGVANVNYTN